MNCYATLVSFTLYFVSDAQLSIPTFEEFVRTHMRTYAFGTAEYRQRQDIFQQRARKAEQHNRNLQRLWTAGVNSRWDSTEAEVDALHARPWHTVPSTTSGNTTQKPGFLTSVASSKEVHLHQRTGEANNTSSTLPRQKSWNHLSAVPLAVRDQGDCGSCWAIAAATVLQAHSEIYMREARTFSVQELVSCVPNPLQCGGTGGCKGATMMLAIDWAWKNGLALEKDRPYVSGAHGDAGQCRRIAHAESPPSQGHGGFTFGMQGWEKLPENREEPLLHAIVEHGPVGVSVASSEWFDYKSGIFDGCSRYAIINHAAVLFGYGESQGVKFWALRNSWGQDWGEDGSMRLLRHGDEHSWCGTDYQPEVGTGCKDGPETVRVCGMCGILYSPILPKFAANA